MSIDINISNYESYLLSYIDGELAGDELAALEVFLERNPAARQELALLEATRLKPEAGAFSFGNKAMLYRGGAINTNNYESYLLSYLDNELSAEEHGQFEQFMRQHPQVKQEMLLWNATRQYPDTSVVFENKSSLYRQTEAKQRKLRPVYWWSAAAAVVAGLLIWQLPQPGNAPATPVAQQQNKPATEQTAPATIPAKASEVNKQTDAAILAAAENISAPKSRITPKTTAPVTKEPKTDNKAATPEQRREQTTAPVIASVTAPERQLATTDIVNKIENEKKTTNIAAGTESPRPDVKEPAIAAVTREDKTQEATVAAAAPAPIQGELIMSVSSSGESKLMNGVTNVARFFSKKRK
ncbi:hypothetical protein [uncultured Chitinophaga sp.]|uniref:hypothetical protein n=1 Tax=uncultured Chitinophaga sp. TaxID=339340 RepID=UPI0025D92A4C|nr:hypothetical protein [uncultured Chitinophaga sp.]